MNELKFTKEVTYELKYQGFSYFEYHYVDNILNQRFRIYEDQIAEQSPGPLGFQGTGSVNRTLEAILVAERIISEDQNDDVEKADLLYLLPDVNKYIKIIFSKEEFDEEIYTTWGVIYL